VFSRKLLEIEKNKYGIQTLLLIPTVFEKTQQLSNGFRNGFRENIWG
jgi:hypothetical protein